MADTVKVTEHFVVRVVVEKVIKTKVIPYSGAPTQSREVVEVANFMNKSESLSDIVEKTAGMMNHVSDEDDL